MSTFNTTYNFNQGNMNFGQALMYGAFGSLTGGMGCFGGGMGMMSPFGMGGSLFSMMGCGLGNMYGTPASFFGMGGFGYDCGGFGMSSFGMGGYGCGMSDSQYVGTLAGMMGSGLLIGGITQAIRNHKAAKAETQAKIDNAKSDVSTLTKEIGALEKENNELETPIGSDGKVTDAASKACPTESKAYTAAKDALDKFDKKEITEFTNSTITSLENELKELKKDPTKNATEISAKEKEINDARIAEKAKQREAYEAKVNTAKADLDAAIQAKINENETKLQELNTKRAEAQAILDDEAEAQRTRLNNKNAKLEAQCDNYDKVDENNVMQEQTTNAGKFNQAYEIFKGEQTEANFIKLKTAYNELVEHGNGNNAFCIKSFTNLMKHILKQHPDFNKTNITWG